MYPFLNIKTNALRRNSDREFTLTSRTNKNALCESCAAFNECPRNSTTLACKEFIPVIRFSVNDGLFHQGRVNTIRTGQAWFKRLEVGGKIALWDGVVGRLLTAVITDLHWEKDKALFLSEHARFNHMVVSGTVYVSEMERLLKSQIGSFFTTDLMV